MANLVRLKQIDQPELSGYVVQITDENYYPVDNPSGFINSVLSDINFTNLSGDLISTGYNLSLNISSVSGGLSTKIENTGTNLQSKISSLSGDLVTTNYSLSVVSGLVDAASTSVTNLETEISGVLSGEISTLNSTISTTSGALNSKISTVSGNLSSRISSLESSFATTGGNFVDITSNNQTVNGTKQFNSRIGFKQIDILAYSGNYSNPGGQHQLFFTQFTEDYGFYASGLGNITGDLFLTKIMQPNNIEVIFSSMIYTGTY